jgi:hypothetical protein
MHDWFIIPKIIQYSVVALIALITTSTTVAIALSQRFQTAHFVHGLSINVSMTLHT